jgi:hypothetical protein
MKNEVAAEPVSVEEQAEIDTVLGIAKKIRARGTYSEPFSEAVRTLNATCARIFHAGPEDNRIADPKDWA